MFRYALILAFAILSVIPSSLLANSSPGNPHHAALVSGNVDEVLELSFFLNPSMTRARCRASFVIEASDATGTSRDEPIIQRIVLDGGDYATLDVSMYGGAVLVEASRVKLKGPCRLLPASRLKNPSTGETQATIVVFSVRGITDESRD